MHTVLLLAAMVPGQVEFKLEGSFEHRVRMRDALIERVGPEILPLTKTYGDVAIYALTKCKTETVRLLCKMDFSAVKHPVALLEAIKKHGEPVGRFVVANHDLLTDADHLEAFTRNPLDFVYDMADLDQRAAAIKTSRLPAAVLLEKIPEGNAPWIIGGVVVVLLAIIWRRRAAKDSP